MSATTGIEWTERTWNPLVGCEYVSAGCAGCYAAREAAGRLSGTALYAGLTYRPEGRLPRFTGEVRTVEARVEQPLHWTKPRKVFVNSMSDLFHDEVPDEFIARVFAVMGLAEWHTFQVLTKRPQRMARLLASPEFREAWLAARDELAMTAHIQRLVRRGVVSLAVSYPLPNVWLGTSVENDRYARIRIAPLLATPAAVRWVSVEPLLGPVSLAPWLDRDWIGSAAGGSGAPHPLLDWVVVGGESGPRARPMDREWVRTIRDDCAREGVPFLFKQWGEWLPCSSPVSVDCDGIGDLVYAGDGSSWPDGPLAGLVRWWEWNGEDNARGEHRWPDGSTSVRVGTKPAGRLLDGVVHDEYPA